MLYNSAEANKLLKKLNEQLCALIAEETQSRTFVASVSENAEDCRPEYDYRDMKAQIECVNGKIRKVKHAINYFNATTIVPDLGMTIDELLIYIPQLSERKRTLQEMAAKLPRERVKIGVASNIIDYTYTNYDVKEVKADLEAVTDLLSKAQLQLDLVNQTEKFEIEI